MAGPANCAAAVPVSTKMPAPMMAPMPRVIRLMGPSARLSVWPPSPSPSASAMMVLMGLVANNPLAHAHPPRNQASGARRCRAGFEWLVYRLVINEDAS